ncbi:mRNA N(3)-methylcytidine methyltransferase METTL8 [Engraulis encrasicolus]|uniref:mRNA N(3)-methylcytidine methyltransferase METTL8 n=1 Tax=Engraulis encrasicolus TaxID=184585 RepID=UPI002FD3831E
MWRGWWWGQWWRRVPLPACPPAPGVCYQRHRAPHRPMSSDGRPPVPLGGRILTDPDRVFQHNMWDHVQWSEEDTEEARRKAEENSSERIPTEEQVKYERDASVFWDGFYHMHQAKFFKDRRWLFQEFPELLPPTQSHDDHPGDPCRHDEGGLCCPGDEPHHGPGPVRSARDAEEETEMEMEEAAEASRQEEASAGGGAGAGAESGGFPGDQASFRILEVGCGAGNSVVPIITAIRERGGFLYCCDFSSKAVQLVKEHPACDGGVCHVFEHDVCDEGAPLPFPPASLHIILLVFVLSAIPPHRLQGVVSRLCTYLRPGGVVLFRDYGRYDLSQLRFKKDQCLSENFYVRRDGTSVYFFTKEEVHDLFVGAGLEELQNLEDRRLQVNRAKKVLMRRVWMQGKFQKPLHPPTPEAGG